jgi:two-component system cell cycle sensor histidine kinase PleC
MSQPGSEKYVSNGAEWPSPPSGGVLHLASLLLLACSVAAVTTVLVLVLGGAAARQMVIFLAVAAGGMAGFVGNLIVTEVRRRQFAGRIFAELRQLCDGVAVYGPSGQALAPAGGALADLPGVEHRTWLAGNLAAAPFVLESEKPSTEPDAPARFAAGGTARVVLKGPGGLVLRLAQTRTALGPTLLLAHDISADRAREKAVQESERKFSELADVASDWIWETDHEHRFTFVSDRFEKLTRLPVGKLVERRLIEIADVRAAPVDIRALLKHMQEQDSFSDIIIPLRLAGPHGQLWIRFAGRPNIDDEGRFLGFQGVAADVTKEYHAEATAEEARRTLRDAIESASEGLAIYSANGDFVMCNRKLANDFAAAGHLLRSGGTLTGLITELLRTRQLRVPEMSPKTATASVMAEIDSAHMRREFLSSNNRWFRISANRSADDGTVLVFTDISEDKAHEAELAAKIDQLETVQTELLQQKETLSNLAENLSAARNEAEAANRAKSEFLAAMSHELRTPLNAVIGFSEVMQSESFGPLGSVRYREYAGDILESGRHLLTLINNILDLSKAEAGRLELYPQAVMVRDIIDASVRIACPRSMKTELAVLINPDATEIIADAQKLKQILINLISNAAKFTPDDGSIRISAVRRGGLTEISVADTGIGMKPEDIPGALTAFRQIDSSLGRKYEGTGLGLPLARRFAELHGGSLEIDSTLGEGTTVVVRIPDHVARAAVA